MDISVITPTWNNCKRLSVTLDAFTKLRVPKGVSWELILVNNNSSDDTDEVVERFLPRLPVVYLKEPKLGVSRARQRGVDRATGSLLLFADDDVRPCPDWLVEYWRAYQNHPDGFFFGGRIVSEFESASVDPGMIKHAPLSIKGLDWGEGERVLRQDEYFIGANWAAPLEVVRRAGGFDIKKGLNAIPGRTVTGEEYDLMNRIKSLGYQPLYLPDAHVHHFVPARKLNARFIGGRLEASGYAYADEDYHTLRGPYIGNLPRWMYRRIGSRFFKYLISRVKGGRAYQEYFDLKFDIGYMRGVRDIRRGRRNGQHHAARV